MFEDTFNERFAGRAVTDISPAFMQSSAVAFEEMSMLMSNVLLAVHEAAKEAASTGIFIKGQSNLFTMQELVSADGKRVMELLGHSGERAKRLSSAGSKPGVLIGSEINNPALANLSVVAFHYEANPDGSGALALIGPVRMDYPRIISTLEYTAGAVGSMLRDLLES